MTKTIKRRRREGKTNYADRIKMLKGGSNRIVFRKTNKYILGQYVTSREAQDKIETGVNSKDLLEHGWPKEFEGSLKSIPAAYLTGFLLGKKMIKEKKEKKVVVDFGMIRALHKSKIYSFLKGLIDAGLEIKHDKKVFPEEDRIKGKNLKKDFSKHFESIKSNLEKI
jgi:large subunit ribosomal protein L18